ncbi:hypothetical protein PCNPT3_01875 [Psychromonas sp. CNPT3]|uniref:hypothetical protein n=1 Tax=Psychromonas sp. CNPT3 TaxID=314282 RepID=UPI00006E762D|nr:hypothetical protein [Psychromonas sp. CNPT3]AGH80317.1 hypothetical protein PCNPT3_01875 [Psychromonas sp. CNPT3]
MRKNAVLGSSFVEILISLWIVSLTLLFTLGLQKRLNTQQQNNLAYVGALSLVKTALLRGSVLERAKIEEKRRIGKVQYTLRKEVKYKQILGKNIQVIKVSISWSDFNKKKQEYSLSKLL